MEMPEMNDENTVGDRINNFIRANRRNIFICLGLVVILLGVFIGAFIIRDKLQERAVSKVEDFTRRYEELRFTITEESSAENVAALMADLSAFAARASGYPGRQTVAYSRNVMRHCQEKYKNIKIN
jgi:hypothetical protein